MKNAQVFFLKAFAFTAAAMISLQAIGQQAQSASPEVPVAAQSWLQHNWLWIVVGCIILLALIASGARRSKTTTVTKRSDGTVEKITTVENES